jgi:hypothetical protein
MAQATELIAGICQRLLFSPKGGIEGALVKVKGGVVQVTVEPAVGTELLRGKGAGKRLRLLAVADKSPKSRGAAHPVFRFEAFADAAGQAAVATGPDLVTIKGVVAALHYARHGEANGVILEGGEFIHLRPHGMAQLGLEVGASVNAVGEVRDTVLGTRLLEARRVNRIDLT